MDITKEEVDDPEGTSQPVTEDPFKQKKTNRSQQQKNVKNVLSQPLG